MTKYESQPTVNGNIGVSFASQEEADAQARAMDDDGNENCYNCSGCSGCSRCSDCSDCSDCSGCSGCSRCSGCSDCSGCSGCSDCSRCSGCLGCSGCSRCSRCSGCLGCSHAAFLYDKEGLHADLSTAAPAGAPAVPIIENIHQAVLDAVSRPDALNMDTWHTCETTHCRAGWVVHLAGEAGRKLEEFHDTPLAALLIYHASSPDLPPVSPTRFYESNEVAMADIHRMAELERGATAKVSA